ncbi:hypothetical protein LguiA_007307 [Lonicera macranthoides]
MTSDRLDFRKKEEEDDENGASPGDTIGQSSGGGGGAEAVEGFVARQTAEVMGSDTVMCQKVGTENIEGILLHPHEREYTIEMGTKAFRKMTKLRLLEIHNACIPKGPDYLPDELRWIDWDKYPSNSLPAMFEADVLVGLQLRRSRLKQLWEGRMKKKLKTLKYVDLSDSQNLVETSHLGEAYGTAVTELPSSIGYLKNLKKLSLCKSSSQSPTSIFQSLFQLRKPQKTTKSLVLAPIWGLTSLTSLDLTDCNLLEGAIPSDLGSLFSLEELCLGGNNFENLPSLNQLSQLAHLELSRCKMLQELPELPSRLNRLFANDCASLRVSADRFALCKLEYGWFQDCRKLLDYGESEIVASTLLQQNLQRTHMWDMTSIGDNIILPGRVIPAWFCNHTFTGDSVLLKLPRTSTGRVVAPKHYSFFVILEVINEVKSCILSEHAEKLNRRYLSTLGLRYDSCNTGVLVELMFTAPCDDHSHTIHCEPIILRNTGNIACLEHTIMGYVVYYDLSSNDDCRKSRWYEPGEIELSMRSLSPDTVVVKNWGVRLIFEDDYENIRG